MQDIIQSSHQEDWKARLKAYEGIFQLMANPSDEVLEMLGENLPQFLSDEEEKCQRTALLICDKYFKTAIDIDYETIANILIDSCLGQKQQIVDLAVRIVIQCMAENAGEITAKLFDGIAGKPQQVILAVISIIVAHLATLSPRDDRDRVDYIIDELRPLLASEDLRVASEAKAAIASARFVCGGDMETLTNSMSEAQEEVKVNDIAKKKKDKLADQKWPNLIVSSVWKDRKAGFEDLLEWIEVDSPLQTVEHHFLIPAGTEKNAVCQSVIVQIIAKMADLFKTQLVRKLREYVMPVVNMLMQKRPSKLQAIQDAFDAIGQKVVMSPYEPPFVEYLLKMFQSGSVRLKEEGIAFVVRCWIPAPSAPVREALEALSSDASVSVRDAAIAALKQTCGGASEEPVPMKPAPMVVEVGAVPKGKGKQEVSPDIRRSIKRKSVVSAKLIWEGWVRPETLNDLSSASWSSVQAGLEALREQFDEDPSHPSAAIVGLTGVFTGKTFTPKVMQNLMQHILFYLRYAPEKINEEASMATIGFAADKILDKRFEQTIFEILDAVGQCHAIQFVFQNLYGQLTVKNPAVPLRVMSYFAHHLRMYGGSTGVNVEDFANHAKTAFTHSNSSIRDVANECYDTIIAFDSSAATFFPYVNKTKPEPKVEETKVSKVKASLSARGKGAQPQAQRIAPEKSKQALEKVKQVAEKAKQAPEKAKQAPEKAKQAPEKPKIAEEKALFPSRVVQMIAKMQPILDTRRALEEVETILNNQIEQHGASSVPSSEFIDLFYRLRQWFKDSNTNIVLAVTKVLELCFRAMIGDDVSGVSFEFLSDMCLLLNFSHKGIKNAALAAFSELNELRPNFVPDILVPTFRKLNVDGKRSGVGFMKGVNLTMDIETYCSLIVTFLADKAESFRDLARPLVDQFLQLPDAGAALRATADQYEPAQKSLILSRIVAIERQAGQQESGFKVTPTNGERKMRQRNSDPFLPLKIVNRDERVETLFAVVQPSLDKYFTKSINASSNEEAAETYAMFLEIANSDFGHFSTVLDVVLLWWAGQALLVKQQGELKSVIQFAGTVLALAKSNDRSLMQFEFAVVLTLVLEYFGRNEELWGPVLTSVLDLSDTMEVVEVVTKILALASSVYTISAAFKMLIRYIAPSTDISVYVPSLLKSCQRVRKLVADGKDHDELYAITAQFMEMVQPPAHDPPLRKDSSPPRGDQDGESGAVASRIPQMTKKSGLPRGSGNPAVPTPLAPVTVPGPEHKSILELVNEPSVQIYRWISDIWSDNATVAIQALRRLSAQMKEDPIVLSKHMDGLAVALIVKLHAQFSVDPIPIRLCKYISVCLLNMFTEAELTSQIRCQYIEQIIYELLTHLTNGISENVLNQVLNAIIIKILEDCPMYAFTGLLSATGEFANYEKYSDKWIRMAVKCLEACGTRICEIGNAKDVQTAVDLVKKFLVDHPRKDIEVSPVGHVITSSFDRILHFAADTLQVT